MASAASRVGAVVIAASAAVVGWGASATAAPPGAAAAPAVVAADPAAPLVLGVHASAAAYRGGEAVPLRFVVTNSGSVQCGLVDVPVGVVRVVSARRDGVPLTPVFGRALLINGAGPAISEHESSVAPGGTVSFTMDTGAQNGVSVLTPLRDGSGLTELWPVQANGRYEFQFAYQVPPLAGADACRGSSNVARVQFTIGQSGSTRWLPIIAVVGGLILLAAVIVVLLMRRGRRRRAAAAAMLAVLATLGLVTLDQRTASADVYYAPSTDTEVNGWYADCVATIIGFNPSLWNRLQQSDVQVVIVHEPILESGSERLKAGGPRDTRVSWNPRDTRPFPGDWLGTTIERCSSLYHELVHAYDAANGDLSERICDSTGILFDEVRATFEENRYRFANGLKPRTTYDGKPLPDITLLQQLGLLPRGSFDDALQKFCFPKKIPPPGTGYVWPVCRGLNSPCAGTYADPHLFTFDGTYYDFQAVGEFVAVRGGDLEVQVRQAPMFGSRVVALNSAIAVKIGESRLGFYLDNGTISVHRDGQPVTPAAGITPLPGATLDRRVDPYAGDVYVLTLPDSTAVWVGMSSLWGMRLTVQLPLTRRGTVAGLLGDFNNDKANDLASATGAAITRPPSYEDLYHTYGDSWRIADATSLFDYAPGQGTAAFTDRTFPDRLVGVSDLAAADRDRANEACRWLTINNPAILDACVLDTALTGQAGFAASAGDTAAFTPPGAAAAGGPPPGPPGTIAIDGPEVAANVTAAGGVARLTFSANAGQKVFVDVVSTTLPNGCGVLTLQDPKGAALAGTCLVNGAGFLDGTVLAASGTYTIVVDPGGTDTGETRLRLIEVVDQHGTLTIDGSATAAVVAQPGGLSQLAFAAAAGQKVGVELTGASLDNGCGVLFLRNPAGNELAAGCMISGRGFIDGTVLPAAGVYSIVVDPGGLATGTAQVRVFAITDQQGVIGIGGPEVTATIAQPGGVARFTFAATAGQKVALDVVSATLPGQCGVLYLRAPTGAELASGCIIDGKGGIAATVLPATGQYTIVVDPAWPNTGEARLRLYT